MYTIDLVNFMTSMFTSHYHYTMYLIGLTIYYKNMFI